MNLRELSNQAEQLRTNADNFVEQALGANKFDLVTCSTLISQIDTLLGTEITAMDGTISEIQQLSQPFADLRRSRNNLEAVISVKTIAFGNNLQN